MMMMMMMMMMIIIIIIIIIIINYRITKEVTRQYEVRTDLNTN